MSNATSFVHALSASASPNTLTENGAVTRSTTGSDVLNLFSQIGGMRTNRARCEDLVTKSLQEDADLTARCVFYSRDPRGGQGEREVFRTNMQVLIKRDPRFKTLISRIPEFGRWDDVVELLDVAHDEVISAIKTQLESDLNAEHPSLLAKWLPSENTSSKVSRAQAYVIRKGLGMTSKNYRKMLSSLRKKIGVIECLMSSGKWNDINFEGVPSNAMMIYRNAFGARAPEKFAAYKAALTKGEAKINASVLFPYDLVSKYIGYSCEADTIVEEQWKALPDFFNGNTENSLVVCDVSGSMSGLPMQVSISLGIYTAERNRGIWKDKFMTFSENPQIQTLVGNTLRDRVRNLSKTGWEMNTNIEAVFTKILDAATATNLDPSEMIARVYIVSDMEFDAASSPYGGRQAARVGKTLFQMIRSRFEDAGYNMPELVFWNVASRNQQTPMALDERGFLNVSGCSPSIFKYVVGKKFAGPYEMMLEVLNSPKYVSLSVTE